jgi:hypothetical protein
MSSATEKFGRETSKLIDLLKDWCDQKRGRQSEAAFLLGTTRQVVNRWFSGVQTPTAEQIIAVQTFLRSKHWLSQKPKRRGARRKAAKPVEATAPGQTSGIPPAPHAAAHRGGA